MDAMEQALVHLRKTEGEVTNQILKDLISWHSHDRTRMELLYERYKATEKGVPVLTRRFEDRNKINNKLNNDFFSEIIDTEVGYFAGEAISYTISDEVEGNERLAELLDEFRQRNDIPDLDAETYKMACICGYGSRLCYIDRDGQEKVMNVDPWECIFISDMSINEPQYAMRYYKVTVKENGKEDERWRVEWYDDKTVKFYMQGQGGYYLEGEQPHLFDEVPLIGFPKNEELQSHAEKVVKLIDGYDNTMSDVNSEIEQFRLAYMAIYGMEVDDETLKKAKKTGAFSHTATDWRMEFITKALPDTPIENHLNRIENNIYRFSKTPNFADEAFAGSQSGEARRYKMLTFENKTKTAERKFHKSLRRMFKVVATAWAKKGIALNYTDIDMTFTRNFPLDLKYEAEIQQILMGLVSTATRLSLFSAIEDPDAEIEAMGAEQTVNLDAIEPDDEPA